MRYIFLTALLLGGCAATGAPDETYWRHAGGPIADGQERLTRDEAVCRGAAYQHATAYLANGEPVFAACMRSRGWVRVG